MNEVKLITRTETAKLLGIKAGTLAVWACTKRYGLEYIKIGARVMYKLEDVLQFIEEHRVHGEYVPLYK